MKNTLFNITEDVLIVFGFVLSMEQLETILGIILLVVQLGLIIYKGIKLIIVKKKNKEDIKEDVENLIEDVTNKIEEIKEKGEKNNVGKDK